MYNSLFFSATSYYQQNSTKSFFFDFLYGNRTKFPAPRGGRDTVCYSYDSPCFGRHELHFSCCSSLNVHVSRQSPLYGTIRNGGRVEVETFYRLPKYWKHFFISFLSYRKFKLILIYFKSSKIMFFLYIYRYLVSCFI